MLGEQLIHQGHLLKYLKIIFPNEETQENVRKTLNIKYPATGSYMEIDVWVPNKQLCFEFQDPHHYITTWYHHHNPYKVRLNDNIKQAKANQVGMSLVEIPCWWDGCFESLLKTLHFHRPDLVTSQYSQGHISLNPPVGYFQYNVLPGVGELMYASFASDSFLSTMENNSWWMGEKYDGIRFCYNPATRQSYTRHRNELELLPEIVANLPSNQFLDGEIWFGRLQYSTVYTLLNESGVILWHWLRMVSFDVPPHYENQRDKFEDRYQVLLIHIPLHHPFNIVAPRILCLDPSHLNTMLALAIGGEGEGIIARKVGSMYEHGRSTSLLKIKAAREDAEAVVVECGLRSVHLKLPNGTVFSVPNGDDPTSLVLRVGDVVSFSCERHSRKEGPYNPKIIRIREDVSWEDLALNTQQCVLQKDERDFAAEVAHQITTSNAIVESNSCRNEVGFWNSIATRRSFIENYARRHGFDPHDPEQWYLHPKKLLLIEKRMKSVLMYHKKNITQMLIDLFPDIGLERSKLVTHHSVWRHPDKRREFFQEYARECGFDHLIPEQWYCQSKKHITARKGGAGVLLHHDWSLQKALSDLFPNIGLDVSKFSTDKRGEPKRFDAIFRKNFFEEFARQNEFDPLNPENWYSRKQQLKPLEGIFGVLRYHKNNVTNALLDLFPDIGLDKTRLMLS